MKCIRIKSHRYRMTNGEQVNEIRDKEQEKDHHYLLGDLSTKADNYSLSYPYRIDSKRGMV